MELTTSELNWLDFKIKRGYTKQQAIKDIKMNRRVSKRFHMGIKRKFPTLKF